MHNNWNIYCLRIFLDYIHPIVSFFLYKFLFNNLFIHCIYITKSNIMNYTTLFTTLTSYTQKPCRQENVNNHCPASILSTQMSYRHISNNHCLPWTTFTQTSLRQQSIRTSNPNWHDHIEIKKKKRLEVRNSKYKSKKYKNLLYVYKNVTIL